MRNHIRIEGSELTMLQNAKKVGQADPNKQMSVTLYLRRSAIQSSLETKINEIAERPLSERQHFNHGEFANTYGVDSEDIKRLEDFANRYNLDIKEVNRSAGIVVLSGATASLNQAFGVELADYEHPDFTYRGHTGHVYIPEDLADVVQGVFGLDNRPQARPHFRLMNENEVLSQNRAKGVSYKPNEVAKFYNYPSDVDCSKQCIGIIELGGGYRKEDITAYFKDLGLPEPQITDVSVDGGKNKPTGDPNSADGEVGLDIEIAAAVASGAKLAVYFAPNTDAGFLKAITTAVHDKDNKPSVLSISWGSSESKWTNQSIKAMNQAFHDAAALGVTICCAAGDRGSSDGEKDGLAHVDFPASSPYVIACGGTKLEGKDGKITKEVVWNEKKYGATGGGISDVFDPPKWQADAKVPTSANPGDRKGRGVPDVAGNADPVTGYQILVDGKQFVVGGTSAVAPLWAGLFAIINQKLGKPIGLANPDLYKLPSKDSAFHDITSGDNDSTEEHGSYKADQGWDACTGLGTPDGDELLKALNASLHDVSK
ncbi:kumamolisin [Scopulibacillus darangshiensis]|uniref:Kumamolisin n=1 Tax=Scopulibacillus darangshiensis TaxID=442528 RepID=A0A4R2NH53_9BACL|nr:S53 family peptidase [Scopulibacillus darangshiensis]TCP20779.1 kumamolisin [Scopulibacillus darangshiensis]